jgi:DNA mismatch repair ATPase MutS
MNVARLANIPASVIKKARQKSDEMQKEMEEKQLQTRQIRLVRRVIQSSHALSDNDVLQELSSLISLQ